MNWAWTFHPARWLTLTLMETVCRNHKLKSRGLCQKSRLYICNSKWQTVSSGFFAHCKEPITIFSFLKLTRCPNFMGIKFWNGFCNSKDKGRNLPKWGYANKHLCEKSSSQNLQPKFWLGISLQLLCQGRQAAGYHLLVAWLGARWAMLRQSVFPTHPWCFPWKKAFPGLWHFSNSVH